MASASFTDFPFTALVTRRILRGGMPIFFAIALTCILYLSTHSETLANAFRASRASAPRHLSSECNVVPLSGPKWSSHSCHPHGHGNAVWGRTLLTYGLPCSP